MIFLQFSDFNLLVKNQIKILKNQLYLDINEDIKKILFFGTNFHSKKMKITFKHFFP